MSELHRRTSQAIDAQLDRLAEEIVARQLELQAERWKPYGSRGREKSVRDVRYHLTYLSEALRVVNPSLFTDYVAWVKVLFAGLHFPDEVLVTTLECTRDTVQERLPVGLNAIASEYVALGLDHLRQAPAALPAFLDQNAPLGGLARQYLGALLRGERRIASRLVLDAVEKGTSIKDVYLHVFQRSQYEIGRLWQMNQITVAQEHYCTAATQLIMSQLYPHLFGTDRIGRRLVATCVGDELHELGVRMVADFFEMEGWDTYYVGANAPAQGILEVIEEQEADLLGISATMTFHVRNVAALITRVRKAHTSRDVTILVGGYPFNVAPDLWQELGADGHGRDAEEAVGLANRLLEGRK
ncbi:MAG: cobalamin-dependent protein [Anaerolineae bacterium]|jgi:methanogenic corrinoid protein MtbC1